MKKNYYLLVFSFLAIAMVPMIALAQSDQCLITHDGLTSIDPLCAKNNTVCDPAGTCANKTNSWGMCCVLNALYTATDWIFIVLIILVGLLIIYGGITIATAGGSPEKATQGRTVILYALIGLAVALLSKALPSVVKAMLGM